MALSNIPTDFYGIPVWVYLFAVSGILLFYLNISGGTTNQDRYPFTRLMLYILATLIVVAGVADFIRWGHFIS